MQGRILYVGAKTDSNDLHWDIQNIEPYGTGLYEQSYIIIIPNQSNYSTRRPLNLLVPRVNQTTYGLRSFRYPDTLLWTVCRKKSKQQQTSTLSQSE